MNRVKILEPLGELNLYMVRWTSTYRCETLGLPTLITGYSEL